MGKPKNQSREERLRKKRLAEKKRYEKIKNNIELWKEKQEKNRLNYLRRKDEKKQLAISEMNPRQQRLQRKRWRKNYKAYYQRKKLERRTEVLLAENTPPQSPSILSDSGLLPLEDNIHEAPHIDIPYAINHMPESPTPGPSRLSCSSEMIRYTPNPSSPIRRIRYKKDKEINNLKKIIINMKRQNERYRKQLQRIVKSKEKEKTEESQSTQKNDVKKTKNTTHNKTKQCTTKKAAMALHRYLGSFPKTLSNEVKMFYEDDENSRLCSGKKEFIVRKKIRKQKRYVSDSLINLHKKFLKKANFRISYSAFCKLRPFWVLLPDSRSRETCLCKLHTNIDLFVQGLYQRKILSTKSSQDLLSLLCCDVYDVDCLLRKCSACETKVVFYQEFDNSIEITYWQWETKTTLIQGTERKIRTTEKTKQREEPKKCIEKFELMLKEYFAHCGNIVAQQKAFKNLKEHIQDGECIIHIDYSENYAVKCNEEIQSYHFGGSRKQLTLHTSVIYFLDDEKIRQAQSFCTVSECLRHDVSAVWAHIVPILDYIGETKTGIHTIHFISDSPSSQYRNKKIFYLISCLHIYLSTLRTITWNYSESGHGKGAPDGVGAVIKRTADRAVSLGQDIKDLDDFLNIMEQNLKKVKLRTISDYDVSEKDFLFPQNVKAFPGCMKMHQIVWNLNLSVLAVRKLSCTDKNCLYQAIACNHMKHLGFYQLENACQENCTVTTLANSKRQLEEIGESFWTITDEEQRTRNTTKERETDTGRLDNQIHDTERNTNVEKKTCTEEKAKELTRFSIQRNNFGKQKGKVNMQQLNINFDEEVNFDLVNWPKKKIGCKTRSDITLPKNTTTVQGKNVTISNEEDHVLDDPNVRRNFKDTKSASKSLLIKTNIENENNIPTETKYEVRRRMINKSKENLELAQSSDYDNISDITFSRDGSKVFSVDLENVNPYLMDTDDDEDFNIF